MVRTAFPFVYDTMTGPGSMISPVRIVPVSSEKLQSRGTCPYLSPQKNTIMVIESKLIGGLGWSWM